MWILLAQACTVGLLSKSDLEDTPGVDPEPFAPEERSPEPNDAGDDPYEDTADDSAEYDTGSEESTEDDSPDLDGDGYGVDDCDDEDPDVHPNQVDGCDGIDNDCDGLKDEDSLWDEESGEASFEIGRVESGDSVVVSGLLYPENDTDMYQFTITDELFGWFFIDALVTDVPDHADIAFSLIKIRNDTPGVYEVIMEVNDGGPGEAEYLTFFGRAFFDDSGTYQLIVRGLSGADCEAPYEILADFGT